MPSVEMGKFVTVHYTGWLESGEEFDSSRDRSPLEVQVGSGQLIPGFENALLGMRACEKKSISLPPEEAYGQRDETLSRSFPRSEVPAGLDPKVGDTVALMTENGHQLPAQITRADALEVTVDLNHPLAGKTLKFEIEVLGISDEPTMAGCECGCGSEPGGGCGSDAGGCGSGGCGSGGCSC